MASRLQRHGGVSLFPLTEILARLYRAREEHMAITALVDDFLELPAIGKTQAFSTDGIVTLFKGPDSFPLTGVRESYEFIPMSGTARRVLFAFEKLAAQAA